LLPERTASERVILAVLAAAAVFLVAIPVTHLVWALHTGQPTRYLFDEDANYVFQVARNVAHGHGISADALHATSGFQPLWAALLVPLFVVGSTQASLALVGLLCLAVWLVGADAFSRLLTAILPDVGLSRRVRRLLFAVLFLADIQTRTLYWGGLETGIYLTLLVAVTYWFVVDENAADRSDGAFGVALGLLALARFEAVIFVVVIAVARAFVARERAQRVRALAVPLAIAAALFVPWLAYCQAIIGLPIPQSGLATGGHGIYPFAVWPFRLTWIERALGTNLSWPVAPNSLDVHPGLVFLIAAGAVVRFVVAWATGIRVRAGIGWVLWALAGAATVVVTLYSATTAAVWFLPRYFAVLAPFQVGLTAAALLGLIALLARFWRPAVAVVVLAVASVAMVAPLHDTPLLDRREQYMVAPVDELTASHTVTRCPPVGMFESGRSGFVYGSRVVNLDGKTNAAALRATTDHRLVDWLGQHHVDLIFTNRVYLQRMDVQRQPWRERYRVVDDPHLTDYVWLVANTSSCTP
jgi:hypothetical protein